jgi:hypothetical protein
MSCINIQTYDDALRDRACSPRGGDADTCAVSEVTTPRLIACVKDDLSPMSQ